MKRSARPLSRLRERVGVRARRGAESTAPHPHPVASRPPSPAGGRRVHLPPPLSLSLHEALCAPPLPFTGEGWGEGETRGRKYCAPPSSGRFATTFSRRREKGSPAAAAVFE